MLLGKVGICHSFPFLGIKATCGHFFWSSPSASCLKGDNVWCDAKCDVPGGWQRFSQRNAHNSHTNNDVLLVKIGLGRELVNLIYHHFLLVKGISSNTSINQPTNGKKTSMSHTTNYINSIIPYIYSPCFTRVYWANGHMLKSDMS